jgi:hypothetical protein
MQPEVLRYTHQANILTLITRASGVNSWHHTCLNCETPPNNGVLRDSYKIPIVASRHRGAKGEFPDTLRGLAALRQELSVTSSQHTQQLSFQPLTS